MNCTQAAKSVALLCADLPVAGLNNFFYLGNRNDFTITEASGVVTGIAAVGGASLYKYEGGDDFANSIQSLVAGGLKPGFTHQLPFIFPSDAQADLQELDNLVGASLIVITNKNGSDGQGTFRLHGKSVGMKPTSVEGDDSNADRDGLPFLTLATPDGKKEPKMPQHVLIGADYDATKTALDALVL